MNPRQLFKFRLYVSGAAPNSVLATENLGSMCRAYLPNRHQIEVVDVFAHPERALADGIFITPMVIKLAPNPARRIAGTLSNAQAVLLAFGLATVPG
jgi:circadian clock protein KaiB